MKPARLFILFAFVLLTAVSLLLFGSSPAAHAMMLNASVAMAPASYVTLSGSTGGQPVGKPAVMDQAGTQDNPSADVLVPTPNILYPGYPRHFLPPHILRSTLSAPRRARRPSRGPLPGVPGGQHLE